MIHVCGIVCHRVIFAFILLLLLLFSSSVFSALTWYMFILVYYYTIVLSISKNRAKLYALKYQVSDIRLTKKSIFLVSESRLRKCKPLLLYS